MADPVFLDRDGVINVKAPEGDYIKSWDEFEFLPGAVDALRALGAARRLVVVTNQRGIALGRMTEEDLAGIHARMLEAIGDGVVDAIYHCPHDDGECDCRKPLPGMLLRAAEELPGVDLSGSAMVGDSPSDLDAGRAVGARLVAIGDAGGAPVDHRAPTLAAAVDWLLCES